MAATVVAGVGVVLLLFAKMCLNDFAKGGVASACKPWRKSEREERAKE